MGLVKCPDCEKMVSPRADKCPFCGCPAKYFIKPDDGQQKADIQEKVERSKAETEYKDENKDAENIITFDLCGYRVQLNADVADFAQVFGAYLKAGDDAYTEMQRLYKEAGSISKALEILPNKANGFIFEIINEGTRFLYSNGINITQEQFYEKYNDKYTMDYSEYYDYVLDKYSEIIGEKNKLAEYREAQKASRGRWSGGGFGLKGAFKGAITASALNMGSDFLHSFGDSAREREDNQKFSVQFRQLYRDSMGNLCHSVKTCIMNVYSAMMEELNAHHFFKRTYKLDREKAETLYATTIKYEQDSKKVLENMVKCILLYPGERKYYEKFKDRIINGKNDIRPFLKFWNIEYLLNDMLSVRDNQNSFDSFMEEKGIISFDFKSVSTSNIAFLVGRIVEYKKKAKIQLNDCLNIGGKYSDKIRGFLLNANRNYKDWDYEIFNWIPSEATYQEFWEDAVSMSELLKTYGLLGFRKDTDSALNQKVNNLLSAEDAILTCCDTSLTKNYGKGLLVSKQYSVDLKSGNKIKNAQISKLEVINRGKDYVLQLGDGHNIIEFTAGITKEEMNTIYLRLVLGMIYMRYCGNSILLKEAGDIGEFVPGNASVPDYVIGYYPDSDGREDYDGKKSRYLSIVQGKYGFDELEKFNLFRRFYKRISEHSYSTKKEQCYVFETENQEIAALADDNIEEYVLYFDNGHLVTDQAVYVGGERFALNDVREFLCMGETSDSYSGYLYVFFKDGRQKIIEEKKCYQIKSLFLSINIVMERVWGNKNTIFVGDEVFCCRKCGSFDVEQRPLTHRCRKCGNKKLMEFYDCAWNFEEGRKEKNCLREYLKVTSLSSEKEKEMLYDENRNYEWILEIKDSCEQNANSTQPGAVAEQEEQRETAGEYIYCAFCGERIEKEATFCNFCGERNPYKTGYEEMVAYESDLSNGAYLVKVERVYYIPGHGPVVTGTVSSGIVTLGAFISIENPDGSAKEAKIIGLECNRELINEAKSGKAVGIMLGGIDQTDVQIGALIKKK